MGVRIKMHLTGFEQRRHLTPAFSPVGDSGEGGMFVSQIGIGIDAGLAVAPG